MCTLTIDCRCDTCIDGRMRYQCPRIIAVDAPPSSAAELRKLAMVSTVRPRRARRGRDRLGNQARPDRRRTPTPPAPDESTPAPVRRSPSRSRSPLRPRRAPTRPVTAAADGDKSDGRSAKATAIRIAAMPALKRKNFTPASRETSASVKMIPRPRWVRKRKRTTLG